MLKSFLKTQALDNLFCCLHTGSRALLYPQWRIQGRGRGPRPLPPLILDQMEARRAKKIVFGDRVPPYLFGSGIDPARFWRSHERLCIRSLLSMRGMLLRYSFEPRPKGRVLVSLGSVMTIDQSINGCSHSEKRNSLARENKIDQSRSMGCGQCPQRFDTIQAERPFHLLTQEEAKGSLLVGCVVFRGNKKVKS